MHLDGLHHFDHSLRSMTLTEVMATQELLLLLASKRGQRGRSCAAIAPRGEALRLVCTHFFTNPKAKGKQH